MKCFNICLFFLFVSFRLLAQEVVVDTVPINTKGMEIKLKRSPLPSRVGTIAFRPVIIAPVIVAEKINYWKTATQIGMDVNQGAFSKNWKNGGTNSLAVG